MKRKESLESGSLAYGKSPENPVIQIKIAEPFNIVTPVEIGEFEEKQKFPKENIRICSTCSSKENYGNSCSVLYIKSCTIQKRWDSDDMIAFDIMGEYFSKGYDDMRMYIMVYNEKNDLIAYNTDCGFNKGITKDGFFSTSIYIPNVQKVSEIELKFAKDPLNLWR